MKDIPTASKDRMGKLSNALVEVINESDVSPLEAMALLDLLLIRMKRSFEVSVMPTTIGGKK